MAAEKPEFRRPAPLLIRTELDPSGTGCVLDIDEFRQAVDAVEKLLHVWRDLTKLYRSQWTLVNRKKHQTLLEFLEWARADLFDEYEYGQYLLSSFDSAEHSRACKLAAECHPESIDTAWLPEGMPLRGEDPPATALAAAVQYCRDCDYVISHHMEPDLMPFALACRDTWACYTRLLPDGLSISRGILLERAAVVKFLGTPSADSADNPEKSAPLKIPNGRDAKLVLELCSFLRQTADDGRSLNQKSSDFCNNRGLNPRKAPTLLRQAQRFPWLWKLGDDKR